MWKNKITEFTAMFEYYVQYEYWFAAAQLILAMMGMGATLTISDFREVMLKPISVSVGLVIQMLVVPLSVFVIISFLGLTGGIAIGFALIAAIPGGTVSNIFTHFAHGNTALSITITAISTIACLASTPLILDFLIAPYMPANFDMPVNRIALEIGLFLLTPLFLGMLFLRTLPNVSAAFSQFCIRGSIFVIGLIIIGSFGAGRIDFKAFGLENIILVICLAIFLIALSRPLGRLFSLADEDKIAIEMEVTVRSINLGFLIKASLFPATDTETSDIGNIVMFTLLFYAGLQLLAGSILILIHRRKNEAISSAPAL